MFVIVVIVVVVLVVVCCRVAWGIVIVSVAAVAKRLRVRAEAPRRPRSLSPVQSLLQSLATLGGKAAKPRERAWARGL